MLQENNVPLFNAEAASLGKLSSDALSIKLYYFHEDACLNFSKGWGFQGTKYLRITGGGYESKEDAYAAIAKACINLQKHAKNEEAMSGGQVGMRRIETVLDTHYLLQKFKHPMS